MAFNWFRKKPKNEEKTEEQVQEQALQNSALIDANPEGSLLAENLTAAEALAEHDAAEQLLDDTSAAPAIEPAAVQPIEPVIEQEQPAAPIIEQAPPAAEPKTAPLPQPAAKPEKTGYFARLKAGLSKTRSGFADLFLGKKALDQDLIDDLEMRLLTADAGIETTDKIIKNVTQQIERKQLGDAQAVQQAVANHMQELLTPYEQPLDTAGHKPYVILMVGINGAGKTTTIGKLAHRFLAEGKKVMLAAGDTFRAAAVEQLQTWGERNGVPVIAQQTGADSASVAYDALQSAKARGADVLIIDTAGRLHTQDHLMEELKKVKRVLQKLDPAVPHQTLLVLDAGNGQNALRQAQHFHDAMQLDGLVITKLDGTAKGGIIFAVTEKLQLPVRYIGVGEQLDDLRPFNAKDFVNALLYAR